MENPKWTDFYDRINDLTDAVDGFRILGIGGVDEDPKKRLPLLYRAVSELAEAVYALDE